MRVLKDTFEIQTYLVYNKNEGSVVYKLNAIPAVGMQISRLYLDQISFSSRQNDEKSLDFDNK